MKYAVEGQELTDIADALRRKHGDTKIITVKEEEIVPNIIVSKSKGSTGFGKYGGEFSEGYIVDVIKIDGSSSIHVKADSAFYTGYSRLYIASGEYTVDTFPDMTPNGQYDYSKQSIEKTFENTDVITIVYFDDDHFVDTSERTGNYGYYAEVWGLDANGGPSDSHIEIVEKEVEIPNSYQTKDMAQAIDDIEIGGFREDFIPDSAFVISGNCNYRFANNSFNWLVEMYGDQITTKDLTSTQNMFSLSTELKELPFDFNFLGNSYESVGSMFTTCYELERIGKIKNMYPSMMNSMFNNCWNLRYLPEFENLNLNRAYTYASYNMSSLFQFCYSLRSIPESLLKNLYNPLITNSNYAIYSYLVQNCYTLDEIRGLSPRAGKTLSSNAFGYTFSKCFRLKDIIFNTQDDGTPYTANWKSQTIDLASSIGWCDTAHESMLRDYLCNYNSGITIDKWVKDDATYQALKNDPDWFTNKVEYSRFNHDSAVNTINSLPDTSAYGTNTIKFKGTSGSATDGGAINTLTEEEIAVAAAKGWTVTLV